MYIVEKECTVCGVAAGHNAPLDLIYTWVFHSLQAFLRQICSPPRRRRRLAQRMPTLATSEYGVTVSFSPPVGSTACATLQQLMKTGEAMSQTFGFEGGNAAPARVISSESAILQQLSPQGCLPVPSKLQVEQARLAQRMRRAKSQQYLKMKETFLVRHLVRL